MLAAGLTQAITLHNQKVSIGSHVDVAVESIVVFFSGSYCEGMEY